MFITLLVSCHCETREERYSKWQYGVVCYYKVTVTKGTEPVVYKAKSYESSLFNPGFQITLLNSKTIVILGNAVFEPVCGKARVVNGMIEFVTNSGDHGRYKF